MTDGGSGENAGTSWIAAAIRSHRSDLIGFLARRLRCFATAEDVAQEACTRLFEAREAVRSPRAFLFQVAANLAQDHSRVHRRRDDLLREAHDILWMEEDQVTPERHIVARDLIERLEAAIADLPNASLQMTARDWVLRLASDEMSAADLAALDAWRAADPAHEHAFAEARRSWRSLRRLEREFERHDSSGVRSKFTVARWLVAGGSAATVAALMLVAVLLIDPVIRLHADYITATGEIRNVELRCAHSVPRSASAWKTSSARLWLSRMARLPFPTAAASAAVLRPESK